MEINQKKRISSILSSCGIASRRKCEELVLEGRVKINGIIIKDLSYKASTDDIIEFDDRIIKRSDKAVIALNKPYGYICTAKDDFSRKTVMELVSDLNERLYPVGRLDINSRGLLIMTNDGGLAYRITHPKFNIPKTYMVVVSGSIDEREMASLASGIDIEGRIFMPQKIEISDKKFKNGNSGKNISYIGITITEGRKRIIRKVFEKLGHKVLDLKRIEIGNYKLGDLKEGRYRVLNVKDIEALLKNN